MNAWGLLYESLQSALIDTLNIRYPSAAPELGLPFAQMQWEAPVLDLKQVHESWWLEVSIEGAQGRGMVCLIAHGSMETGLWDEFLKTATREFKDRAERLRVAGLTRIVPGGLNHKPGAPDWTQFGPPSRVVWTPIQVSSGASDLIRLFLGLGILV